MQVSAVRLPRVSRLWPAYVGVALAALVVRAVPFAWAGSLTAQREYDDGVAYLGARALAAGQLPYRDFVFLHPPGVLVAMLPFAGAGTGGDDAVRLAVARLVVLVIGVLNAVLVARLLRPVGTVAMLVGGLGYAVWGAAASAERTVLLEPGINLGLLVALCLLQGRSRRAEVWAGVAIGLALTVKYWSVVDVGVLLLVVAARSRVRGALRYLGGVALGAGVVALPFFVAAPRQMWQQTVVTQLTRPPQGVSLGERGAAFAPLAGLGAPDVRAPGLLWLVGLALVLLLGLTPVAVAVRRRTPVREWPDEAWWAVVALAHLALLVGSASFYYHYAAWAAAPLALVVGVLAQRAWDRAPVRGGQATLLGLATITVLGVVAVVGMRVVEAVGSSATSRAAVVAWSASKDCVWGLAPQLVWAAAATGDVEHGCALDVDAYGANLVQGRALDARGGVGDPAWGAAVGAQLGRADGVLLPTDPGSWPLDASRAAQVRRDFVLVGETAGVGRWDRRAAAAAG